MSHTVCRFAEMALSMTESEAADKTSQLNRLEQALLSRLRSVEAREVRNLRRFSTIRR